MDQPSAIITSPNKPSRWSLIIVSFLTIFSLAASGWLFYQNLKLQKQISQLQTQPTPLVSPEPSAQAETAGWKTYTNTNYSFSIKYPDESLSFIELPQTITNKFVGVLVENNNTNKVIDNSNYESYALDTITILENTQNKSLVDFIAYPKSEECQTTGYDSQQYLFADNINSLKASCNSYTPFTRILFQSNFNPKLIFRIDSDDSVSSHLILSTFKFLTAYTCPLNGWQNCMPILSEEGKRGCSPEAIKWYETNCPNFQGVAQ